MPNIPLTLISTGSRGEQLDPSTDGLVDAAGFSFIARGDIPGSTADTTNLVLFGKDPSSGTLYQGTPSVANVTDIGGGAIISTTPLRTDDTNGLPDAYVALNSDVTNPGSYLNLTTNSNGASYGVALHGDGWVWTSDASNLVAGDTNGMSDIFYKVPDFSVVRISTDSNGNQADGPSWGASGTNGSPYILFTSAADNLTGDGVAGGVFIKNYGTGATVRASTTSTGAPVTASGGDLDYNGNLAVFATTAANVVPGDTNGVSDIFLKNMSTGQVTLVSANSDGSQLARASHDPHISPDGQFVTFEVDTSSGTQIYAKNLQTGALSLVTADDVSGDPSSGNSTILNMSDSSVDFLSTAGDLIPGVAKGGIFVGFLDPSTFTGTTLAIPDASFILPDGSNNLRLSGSASQAGTGNSLDNIITSNNYGSILDGAAGNDTLVAGRGADTLTGGSGNDTFAFHALPWSAGQITDFTIGADKLDLSSLLQASGYGGTDPIAAGYVILQSDGSGGTQVLYDTDGPGTGNTIQYRITDLDNVSSAGLGWAQLTGSASTGGGGSSGETLTSSKYGDTLVGGPGDDTLNAGQGPDTLTGNGGADTFSFAKLPWNAGHVTDFTIGTDKLDLSALFAASGYTGSDPVADGYVILQSDGSGGTELLYDTDGPGSGNTIQYRITDLDHVATTGLTWAQLSGGTSGSGGGSGGGGTTGITLTANDTAGQVLTGTSGDDIFYAGHNSVVMTGNGGADSFVFQNLPWNAGQITDFTPGTDKLDLSALFTAAKYHGTDPIADGYLKFTSDGAGDTQVSFNPHDPNNPYAFLVTTLDHVAPANIHTTDWIF